MPIKKTKLPKLKLKSMLRKPDQPADTSEKPEGKVSHGKPVFVISYTSVKFLSGIVVLFLLINVLYSLKLIHSAIAFRSNLGEFLNMVSGGDGDILPSTQAVPAFILLCMDTITLMVFLRLFSDRNGRRWNRYLFILIMVSLLMMVILIVVIIYVAVHANHAHEHLHNGIIEVMRNYANDSASKRRVDRLQIELQCCGSKRYDEWYNITWFDASLLKKGSADLSEGNTPFSCCSMTSTFPCIHHDIERTGKIYLYTPEHNLSVSSTGCYDKLREKEKAVGLEIIGNLFLYIALQIGLIVCLRFLQTAHCVTWGFNGHKEKYTIWLIGRYVRKQGVNFETEDETKEQPPETVDVVASVPESNESSTTRTGPPLPPVPAELLE